VLTGIVACAFLIRIGIVGGYYVISYILGIYLLNLLIGFLTPMLGDLEDEENDEPVLPISDADEFKPFMRKVPEFKFWANMTISILIGFSCTFFEALDVPVFWPILVIYFVFLMLFTLRR
jgi:uncharacterized membrane protein